MFFSAPALMIIQKNVLTYFVIRPFQQTFNLCNSNIIFLCNFIWPFWINIISTENISFKPFQNLSIGQHNTGELHLFIDVLKWLMADNKKFLKWTIAHWRQFRSQHWTDFRAIFALWTILTGHIPPDLLDYLLDFTRKFIPDSNI